METTEAFQGLRCLGCDESYPVEHVGRCENCGAPVGCRIEPDPDGELPGAPISEPAAESIGGPRQHRNPQLRTQGIERYEAVLPFPADAIPSLGEGGTPLLELPYLAEDLGVDTVYLKDEGRNPTGTLSDRGAALGLAAARGVAATHVALPSMGNTAQAVAAYAARAGLTCHGFVPTRTPFVNKAMINVHGGAMNVVEGGFSDAVAAFEAALGEHTVPGREDADRDAEIEADATEGDDGNSWYPLAAFSTPWRHEGAATIAYEILQQLGGRSPDALVQPTGHGTALAGIHAGFERLQSADLLDQRPRLFAAQAGGCGPLAAAWAAGATEPIPVEHPDTICGDLEIGDPPGGGVVLDALETTEGAAIGTGDEAILAAGVDLAQQGITASVSAGAALAGARALADQGAFDADDVIVLCNPTSGNKQADVLRSHLMGKGM